jgi:sulfatase modifying factor 1
MGNNPSLFNGVRDWPEPGTDYGTDLSRPVEQVTWYDAVAYCEALTRREQAAGRLPTGYVYRLPTEAEWEYACRADTTTPFHYGSELRSGMANFEGHYEYPPCGDSDWYCFNPSGTGLNQTRAVGGYAPNVWGLHDMHGNVWEWCSDWYAGSLPGGSVTDPQGPATGSFRVLRGGCFAGYGWICRSAYRYPIWPHGTNSAYGFRVVLAGPLATL